MPEQTTAELQHSISECLRQWLESLGLHGFESTPQENEWNPRCATVRIEGPTSWSVEVGANEPLLQYVALEMTGASKKNVDHGLMDDILREFANTVAGNLYPTLDGARSMTIPRSAKAKGITRAFISLQSENMRVRAALLVEEPRDAS